MNQVVQDRLFFTDMMNLVVSNADHGPISAEVLSLCKSLSQLLIVWAASGTTDLTAFGKIPSQPFPCDIVVLLQ